MSERWGPLRKFRTWRRLWLCARRGRGRTRAARRRRQVAAHQARAARRAARPPRRHRPRRAAEHEKRLRHDVMAHVHTLEDVAPGARDIIHLGATSCYVTDNADLILMRESLHQLCETLAAVIDALGTVRPAVEGRADARLHALPAGAAHHRRQAGAPVAVRLRLDLQELERRRDELPFRGAKGTTGTQASFLALFRGDHEKVKKLDRLVARKMGFAPRRSRSPARPTRARSTRRSSTRCRASRSRPTSGAPTCGCSPTGRRSTSRSRRSRSARRRWPTSGTRCGPSGCARWRAT